MCLAQRIFLFIQRSNAGRINRWETDSIINTIHENGCFPRIFNYAYATSSSSLISLIESVPLESLFRRIVERPSVSRSSIIRSLTYLTETQEIRKYISFSQSVLELDLLPRNVLFRCSIHFVSHSHRFRRPYHYRIRSFFPYFSFSRCSDIALLRTQRTRFSYTYGRTRCLLFLFDEA